MRTDRMQPFSSATSVSDPPARPAIDPRASAKIRVLYAGNADFARVQFGSEAPQLQLVVASDAGIQITDGVADVAFIDTGTPGMNAAALLDEWRGRHLSLPVVLAVDPAVIDAARLAVDLHVDDYTVKSPGWVARLPVRLAVVVARHRRLAQLDIVRKREARLRSIVESAPVSLARVNRGGAILAMNDAARAMLGGTQPADVLRKPFLSFVAAGDRSACERFIALACEEQAGTLELSVAAASGAGRRVEATAVKVAAADTEPSAVLLLRDVAAASASDRNEALEAQLAESRRLLDQQRAESSRVLEEERAAHRHRLNAVETDARQIHARVGELEEQLRAAETRTASATEAARAAFTDQLNVWEAECRLLESERDVLYATLVQRQETYDADTTAALALRSELERSLEEAQAAVARAVAERDEAQRALAEANARQAANVTTEFSVRALEYRLEQAETERKRLLAERDDALPRWGRVQEILAALRSELEGLGPK